MASISELQIRDSIREILRNADLSALSSKTVRKKLEEKFHVDLTSRKQEIDDILMSLINSIGEEKEAKQENDSENGGSGGESDEEHDEGTSNGKASASTVASASRIGSLPFAKTSSKQSKRKRSRSSSCSGTSSDSDAGVDDNNVKKAKSSAKKRHVSDALAKANDASSSKNNVDDEALARELQQQELRMRPRASKQKKPKATKSASSDGSTKKKGNSVYSQECVLSPELAAVMGTDRLARKDVVSRMWKIFKERDLLDPKNKQYVLCDEQLEKVFKNKRVKAFGMMRFLKTHIRDPKLIAD